MQQPPPFNQGQPQQPQWTQYPPPSQPPSGAQYPPQQPMPSQHQQYYPQQQMPSQHPQWQQQPMYQQQPSPMPPTQPQKKPFYRSPLGMGCGALIVLLLLCGLGVAITNAAKSTSSTPDTANIMATQPASAPTTAPAQKPTPTHVLKWTTTHTFSGTGSKKTGTFTVPDDWRIAWSCNPASFNGFDYNMVVFVYAPGGSLVDSGVNSMCKKTNTHDVAEIHTGGQVFLDVTSEGDWTIQIQELK